MKILNKWHLSLFCLATFALQLSAQVPNGGFENWTDSEPDQWFTGNSRPEIVTLTQSNTAHSGNYSIRGEVVSYYTYPFPPSLISNDGIDPGFPIDQPFGYLNGYYQFHDAGSSSFMFVDVVEFGIDGEDTLAVAAGAIIAGKTESGFQPFSVKIYKLAETPVAEYCQILFSISDSLSGFSSIGSYFLLDDLTMSGTTEISPAQENPGLRTFTMEQNYPNPFNPETTIRYSIAENSHVVLHVFDIAGRTVATLVDEDQTTGDHEVRWNAGNLAGGIYFYELSAGNQIQTRRMILLR